MDVWQEFYLLKSSQLYKNHNNTKKYKNKNDKPVETIQQVYYNGINETKGGIAMNWLMIVAAKTEPTVGVVVLTGVTLVFFILVLIMFLIQLQGKLFQAIDQKKTKKQTTTKAEPAPTKQPTPVVQEGIPPEVVAVIGAAVTAMSPNYRIQNIKPAKPNIPTQTNHWAQAGVMENTTPFSQ